MYMLKRPPHALLCVHHRGGKAHLAGLQSRPDRYEGEGDGWMDGWIGKMRERQEKRGIDKEKQE